MRELLGSAWLEINLDHIKKNIQNIRNLINHQIQIMGVVKGNGYGHDIIEVSKTILENGVNQLAVARIEEAIVLRKKNIKVPILVLGISPFHQMDLYFQYHIMPTISVLQTAHRFNDMAEKKGDIVKIHLKVETGMGRLGINPEEVVNVLSTIRKMKNIEIQGVYTHFSTADEPDKEYTLYQFKIFKKVIDEVKKINLTIPFYHVANSSALLELPVTRLDLVRPGCAIYGLYPSHESRKTIQLYPALSFKSSISFIKKEQKGRYIGYGRTYQTNKETLVGIIPVGYADGYSRSLSNRGMVLVRGKNAPVIGKVCMDQMMIDVTNIEGVNVGDEVLLWGEQMGKGIRIESIAEMLNTIVDEVVHLTDKDRVAKLFIKNGKPCRIKNILGEFDING